MAAQSRVRLSASEQDWLAQHPVVRVGVIEDFAPLSFLMPRPFQWSVGTAAQPDQPAHRFAIRRGSGRSLDRQIEQLKAGELDVLPVVTPSSEREAELQFTRAYLNNPFVLISATTAGSPRSLDDLQGKRLAIYRGHPLREYLVRRVPRFSGGGAQSR
jgi:two-component system sensor histidine kinase EvgS